MGAPWPQLIGCARAGTRRAPTSTTGRAPTARCAMRATARHTGHAAPAWPPPCGSWPTGSAAATEGTPEPRRRPSQVVVAREEHLGIGAERTRAREWLLDGLRPGERGGFEPASDRRQDSLPLLVVLRKHRPLDAQPLG